MMASERKTAAVRPAATLRSDGMLRRKCACAPGGEHCDLCPNEVGGGNAPSAIPDVVHDVLSSPGERLDHATRTLMEPRFGRDLSHVRVHADSNAAESARAVNALAYTVGRDVVFAAGKYSPSTSEGRGLLAHELTHVVQQAAGAASSRAVSISTSREPEIEADRMAAGILRSQAPVSTHTSAPGQIQRQPAAGATPTPPPMKTASQQVRDKHL